MFRKKLFAMFGAFQNHSQQISTTLPEKSLNAGN